MKILKILLFIIFSIEGITKLIGLQFQINAFDKWGYPPLFIYVIGTLELIGAIGLLIPKVRIYVNIGLIGIIIGAFYTHISRHDPFRMMGLAIITSLLLIANLLILLKKNKVKLFISRCKL